jgi:hypothetical protein
MIIMSERKKTTMNDHSYDIKGPFDHWVPQNFADFLVMHAKIYDADTHVQLQNDLVEHFWSFKGEAGWIYLNFMNYFFY